MTTSTDPPLPHLPGSRSLQLVRVSLPWVWGLVASTALWFLLRRSLITGKAQSFDPTLYARSLWGIAHGDFYNPIIGRASLGIHTQLVLFLLAPFAHVAKAIEVLIAAQALAFGATLAVWLRALIAARPCHDSLLRLVPFTLWATFLFVYAQPFVGNPFLFDARPDLFGVFALTVGLLRCAQRQRIDATSLGWMLASILAREELALIVAWTLVLAPIARDAGGVSWRARCSIAGACVAYFVVDSLLAPRGDSIAAHLMASGSLAELISAKLVIVGALLAGAGGLGLLGARWLVCAVPGAVLLLASSWMTGSALSLQYGMFVAPSLLVASWAGYAHVQRSPPKHLPVWLLAHGISALGIALVASAWPLGALFASDAFDVQGPEDSVASWSTHSAALLDAHAALAKIPADRSLLAPFTLSAPLADRASLRLFDVKSSANTKPDTVVVLRDQWPTIGRALREQGFRLSGLSQMDLAVLARKPWTSQPGLPPTAADCDAPAARWPDAGIALCNAWRSSDGHVHVVVLRDNATPADARDVLLVRADGIDNPLLMLDGIMHLDDLAFRAGAWTRSERPVSTPRVTLSLLRAGDELPVRVGDQLRTHLTITLASQ